jgi:penicillin-binding protein 1C
MKKIIFFIGFVAAIYFAAIVYLAKGLPKFAEVRQQYRVSDRLVLDRNGLVLDEIRVDKKARRLDWVTLDRVSPVFMETLLRAEDVRFRYHPGVDPIALVKSIVQAVGGHASRGASTISMQVAAFLDRDLKRQKHRNVREKLLQVLKALALEVKWSKNQILEAYINEVYFRGELQGLAAASHGLLDKAPYALTLPDSAVLVALIRAPNAELAKIKQRACWLVGAIEGKDTCRSLGSAYWSGLEQGYQIRTQLNLAPHVARMLVAQKEFANTPRITSTLDRELQDFILKALRQHILRLRNQNMTDGAVVVIENSTGNVLSYVGNMGALSKAPHVDGARALRQAGSTLKPFLYAKAIENRIMTAATLFKDEPLGISVGNGVYRPNNFDKGFRTIVSLRSALGSSLNIPAVEALEMLGVDMMVDTLGQLGISNLREADYYGPSLALGSADVRLIEMANAYRTLANKGVWSPVHFYPGQPGPESYRVFSEPATFIVNNILSDRESRADTFGLDSVLSTRFWTAVKTGTSKDMRDNWCLGFSEKYTVGVWAGNFSGESMWNISGVHGAAPVWEEVMMYLHRKTASDVPEMPNGILKKFVKFPHSGQSKDEYFIVGTEPSNSNIVAEEDVRSRITYPVADAFVALDPNIPKSRHRMFFQISGPTHNLQYFLDGKFIAPASNFYPWEPILGRHKLELRSDAEILDQVSFEVRGRHYANVKIDAARKRLRTAN